MTDFQLDLETFWFLALAFFWVGYLVLEGFDFGVGMLLPFLSRDESDRRVLINTIGPHWDGNEVWLIVAGAGTFAAFPDWYATLFSGYFLALLIILVALVVRAVSFEYRGKHDTPRWRANWDRVIVVTSFLPALLWGVALAGLLNGVPIAGNMQFDGNFFDLVQPYALMGGVTTLTLSLLCGAVFLGIKTEGELRARARTMSAVLARVAAGAVVIFTLWTSWGVAEDIIPNMLMTTAMAGAAGAVVLTTGRGNEGWTFLVVSLTIATTIGGLFISLYPNVMVSTLGDANNLTIYNTASSNYTLTVMTVVALVMLPIVLAYQAVSYYVFRARVSGEQFEGLGQAVGQVADKLHLTQEQPPQTQVDPPTE
ncbi:MAG: cytochrome d ubiquinol oxidase subunit II [Solirubrobacteraceae bacterium]|nr:cytochrome d ubiquinol oxidase subunit II [Solirubrobacteraceae bacterium]